MKVFQNDFSLDIHVQFNSITFRIEHIETMYVIILIAMGQLKVWVGVGLGRVLWIT